MMNYALKTKRGVWNAMHSGEVEGAIRGLEKCGLCFRNGAVGRQLSGGNKSVSILLSIFAYYFGSSLKRSSG